MKKINKNNKKEHILFFIDYIRIRSILFHFKLSRLHKYLLCLFVFRCTIRVHDLIFINFEPQTHINILSSSVFVFNDDIYSLLCLGFIWLTGGKFNGLLNICIFYYSSFSLINNVKVDKLIDLTGV